MWLLPLLLLASQAWALGLGEIRLSSALNQPMYAEIELLSATPEELNNLTIQLADADTFARYNLDRPLFLTRLEFEVIESGRVDGNLIRVTSSEPVSEPFITFLVEASWSRGRLLREYTILLDPPTFAPPPVTQSTQAVTAPTRATPSDAGQIQRTTPAPAPQSSQPTARPPAQSQPAAAAPQNSGQNLGQPNFDTTPGSGVVIQPGDTLWGIASRVRPDSRLTMNQTMLAIYEANPQAFAGNINVMRAGASLRIPSADDVYRISRGQALSEVQRQNAAWGSDAAITPDSGPSVAEPDIQPTLTLVPPDEDLGLTDDPLDTSATDPLDDPVSDVSIDPTDARINEIQAILEDQDALLEISDNELAALRSELANLRGEELPSADVPDEILVDDDVVSETPVEDVVDDAADTPPAVVTTTRPPEKGIVETILGYFDNVFVLIGGLLVVVLGILVWFMRRAGNRDDEEATGVWEALDADEFEAPQQESGTERLQALARDKEESFVVEEAGPTADPGDSLDTTTFEPIADTVETGAPIVSPSVDANAETGSSQSIEDTFSSETAINLDQSDPVAEADFHMAYGLYDQAADLITGALNAEPERQDLLAKLCEIYFVWGNRDSFVDAAGRLKGVVGNDDNTEWDKIVIMGQQIAGDHEMFSGVSAEGVSRAVDLSFDGGSDDAGELDIDFAGGPDSSQDDVIDLGGDGALDTVSADATGEIDFSFDDPAENDLDASVTREMESRDVEEGTAEMPVMEDLESTAETPTIEEQFAMDATGELPAIEESNIAIPESDATAEINLDDLGLDLGGLDETSVATDDELINDLDDTAESQSLQMSDDLDETGTEAALDGTTAATGTIEELSDLDATGQDLAFDPATADTGIQPALDLDDVLAATGELPSLDEATGMMPALGDEEATMLASLDDDVDEIDVGIEANLLDATGRTQILTEDMAVETATNSVLSDDDVTMLASLDDDEPSVTPGDIETVVSPVDGNIDGSDYDFAETEALPKDDDGGEFDFAKTEALPKDVFSADMSTDETGRMPGLTGGTDLDLDLDDLTAALKVSEVGDTINQMRDEATVEQPRIDPNASESVTQSLAPDELSGDLHEARTMTEVGTKLDLARAYVDMGDPGGARSILEEVLDEGDEAQKQQAQQLLDSLPS